MQQVVVVRGRRILLVLAVAFAVTAWRAHARSTDLPHHARVVVTDTETTILDVVRFEPGTAKLCTSSQATLDAVAETLRGNPSITLVEVQSHTAGVGDAIANQTLSEQRAAVVRKYLIAAGVEPARLVSEGYGDSQPIAPGAPEKNERISFLILRRS